jgi:hypothetical protein
MLGVRTRQVQVHPLIAEVSGFEAVPGIEVIDYVGEPLTVDH